MTMTGPAGAGQDRRGRQGGAVVDVRGEQQHAEQRLQVGLLVDRKRLLAALDALEAPAFRSKVPSITVFPACERPMAPPSASVALVVMTLSNVSSWSTAALMDSGIGDPVAEGAARKQQLGTLGPFVAAPSTTPWQRASWLAAPGTGYVGRQLEARLDGSLVHRTDHMPSRARADPHRQPQVSVPGHLGRELPVVHAGECQAPDHRRQPADS